jgi:hypothetical protein
LKFALFRVPVAVSAPKIIAIFHRFFADFAEKSTEKAPKKAPKNGTVVVFYFRWKCIGKNGIGKRMGKASEPQSATKKKSVGNFLNDWWTMFYQSEAQKTSEIQSWNTQQTHMKNIHNSQGINHQKKFRFPIANGGPFAFFFFFFCRPIGS